MQTPGRTPLVMRDCYLVLGVARDESAAGIRTAYHHLARHYRSARAAGDGSRGLGEIDEAYEMLSDAQRRRAYDRALAGRPATDWAGRTPIASDPITILSGADTVHPSLEALRQRFLRAFAPPGVGVGVPKSERLEALHMDLVLSPEEAARGTNVDVNIPTFATCPACEGSGHTWGRACSACGQVGVYESAETLRVRVPALVPSGSVIEIPLSQQGIDNLLLSLRVFVSA